MPDLHGNGIYESYMSELFNPALAASQLNPGLYGAGPSVGQPGAFQPGMFGQPQTSQSFGVTPAQVAPVIQLVQQIATQQAAQAIQLAHALQALNKIVHGVSGQHHGAFGMQPQIPGAWGQQTPFAQSPFTQSPFGTQGLQQQQAIQQLLQYLGVQPHRYGLAA